MIARMLPSWPRPAPASRLYTRFLLRLLPLLALAFALAAGVTTWLDYLQQRHHALLERQQTLTVFSHALSKPLWDCDSATVLGILKIITQQASVRGVAVHDQCSDTTLSEGQVQEPTLADLLRQPLLHLDEAGRSHQVGELRISFAPISVLSIAARGLGRQLVIFGTMLAAVLASMAWVFDRLVSQPLEQLRQAMRRHDEVSPLPSSWAEELTEVTQAYNTQVLELRNQARHDPLTGLGNRLLLEERLQLAIDQAQRQHLQGYLLLLDLNAFKPINDRYGHAAGDLVLQVVGQRLRHCVRESDLVARLGGDEFVVMTLDDGPPGQLDGLLGRIYGSIAKPIAWNQITLQVSASIGVARFLRDGSSSSALLAHADQAMYRDKLRQRGLP
ncbi:hypothetical protein MASR1M59_29140 [Melaminivora sp.]